MRRKDREEKREWSRQKENGKSRDERSATTGCCHEGPSNGYLDEAEETKGGKKEETNQSLKEGKKRGRRHGCGLASDSCGLL